jgi:hypothetical protein
MFEEVPLKTINRNGEIRGFFAPLRMTANFGRAELIPGTLETGHQELVKGAVTNRNRTSAAKAA